MLVDNKIQPEYEKILQYEKPPTIPADIVLTLILFFLPASKAST
jgi:hypothetical protein